VFKEGTTGQEVWLKWESACLKEKKFKDGITEQ
jgi:hypothetical protein